MPIIFEEETKRQKYLLFVFIILVLLTIFVLWEGYFAKRRQGEILIEENFLEIEEGLLVPEEPFDPVKKAEINFEVFDKPLFKKLKLFE